MLIITYLKFLLILILIIPMNIYSLEFSEWSEEAPTKKNIIVESEIRYKWYENIIVNEHFDLFKVNSNHIINLNEFKYTDYSLFSIIKPEGKLYREIEEETRAITCESDKFNKIILKDFTLDTNISEISIKNKTTNEDILYSLSGDFEGLPERIDDSNFSKSSIDVTNESILILSFDQEYYMNNINIFMYIIDNDLNIDSFKMIFLKDRYPISEKTLIVQTDPMICFADKCKMTINHDSSWSIQTEFIEKYYRYRDKLFKYYDIERKYLDGYYITLNGYIKDETQSKIFYRYKEKNIFKNINKRKVTKEKITNLNKFLENKKEEKNNIKEKVEIFKTTSKQINKKNSYIKIVTFGLILSFIYTISRILYKKYKISRTI